MARGFQLFTSGITEVPKTFRKSDLDRLPTKHQRPVNDTIYKTVKRAESALNKYRCDVFSVANTIGQGTTTFAESYYLMELEYDENTNKIDHYICVWAYAPRKKDKKDIDDEEYDKDFDF